MFLRQCLSENSLSVIGRQESLKQKEKKNNCPPEQKGVMEDGEKIQNRFYLTERKGSCLVKSPQRHFDIMQSFTTDSLQCSYFNPVVLL